MTHTPKLQHDIDRFEKMPDLGIERLARVNHWHLHNTDGQHDAGDPVPVETPDEWLPGTVHEYGKSAYPVNWDGLRSRMPDGPRYLEMEIGPSVYKEGADFAQLGYVGKVAGVVEPDCVYGNSWSPGPYDTDSFAELQGDISTYALIGCPDRLAVSLYGAWSLRWAGERADKIARACRLADAIQWKTVRPVCFISPFVEKTATTPAHTMGDDEWWRVCMATLVLCSEVGADALVWWDGGNPRAAWTDAEQRKVDIINDVWAMAATTPTPPDAAGG